MKHNIIVFSILLELFGFGITAMGIGMEIASHAHIGFIVITTGACLLGLGGFVYAKLGVMGGGKK